VVERTLRLLVVEDEMMVAMLVEDMIRDSGWDVAGPAMNLAQALELARNADIDGAVLDLNLGGDVSSLPVAAVLRERGIPFIFATGYGSGGDTRGFKDAPVVRKPFSSRQLIGALRAQLLS
jgi:DNA-binding response OmpR family regulator